MPKTTSIFKHIILYKYTFNKNLGADFCYKIYNIVNTLSAKKRDLKKRKPVQMRICRLAPLMQYIAVAGCREITD